MSPGESVLQPPPDHEFAFQIRIDLGAPTRFEPTTPMGGRVYVPVIGGTVAGPLLQGRLMPQSGGNWPRGRADGVAEINAHYMLETSDGTPIYVHDLGYTNSGDQAALFVCTPVFDVPVGPHDWLASTVIVGIGQRHPGHAIISCFTIRS